MVSAPSVTEKHCILLVDDEEALVWSLSQRITKLRPDYQVETAGDGQAALNRIGAGLIDLLITDIRMPGMSGLDLIMAARRVQPSLPVIVMTAYSTPDVDQEIRLRGSIEYLEKPFEFERFLSAVDHVLENRRVGFSGAISVQTLPDVVQLYALSGVTGLLVVRHRTAEGCVWFERGTVTHVTTPTAVGDEAFYEIMVWRGGDFSMQMGAVPTERSIKASWTELLMESCRRIDERQRQLESSGPNSRAGWNLAAASDVATDAAVQHEPGDHVYIDMMFTDEVTVFPSEKKMANDIKQSLSKLEAIDGFVGAALVDSESGMLLGQEGGGGLNLEVAGATNAEVVRSKRKAIRSLNLKDEIEDILISLSKQYHIIRPLRKKGNLFFYVVLDRSRANLALARLTLADIEKDLEV